MEDPFPTISGWPAAAAPPAAPAMASAAAPPAAPSAASLLGLTDPELELDDLKEAAQQELTSATSRAKRPKLTHGMFFDDDNGLKKVLKTFPKIKFQGKGQEFDDLKLLIRNYERWFKDLYPFGDHFEDMVWKTRTVLQEKEKDDEGFDSDPRERLHLLRFAYKNGPKEEPAPAKSSSASASSALPEDVRRRIEENRQRALELKRQREAAAAAAAAPAGDEGVDMETLFLIEENRARALALKQQRLSAAAGVSAAPAPRPSGGDEEEEEDPFGFGASGMDEDNVRAPLPRTAAASAVAPEAKPAAAPAATSAAPMEDEDLFGPPQAGPPQAGAFDEPPDEDIFDFGNGFDD